MACRFCDQNNFLNQTAIDAEIAEQLSFETPDNLVSEEKRNQRLDICETCPFFQNQICTKCGCYAEFRTALKIKACPINKWAAVK
ncbi:DUF6171 family protein [Enterococcus timonensis]|uniref:DUF6171 family protein n=1 Tax=Enterococcus timonensis TaxID=1852364 RepID=UPI0008DA5CC4|nr:DUF6171 family protein [Enterococcus timonensis]